MLLSYGFMSFDLVFPWWRCAIESITKRKANTDDMREEQREERRRKKKKKTGIKIDFSIMLAVSRGRHMF